MYVYTANGATFTFRGGEGVNAPPYLSMGTHVYTYLYIVLPIMKEVTESFYYLLAKGA